jgi:hypothetical protein
MRTPKANAAGPPVVANPYQLAKINQTGGPMGSLRAALRHQRDDLGDGLGEGLAMGLAMGFPIEYLKI